MNTLSNIVTGLMIAYFLKLFGFYPIMAGFIEDIFTYNISINTYYMIFVIMMFISDFHNKNSHRSSDD